MIAFHEAGHALCSELLPGVDRTHKVSIVPRGKALGYVLHFPEEDRYLRPRGADGPDDRSCSAVARRRSWSSAAITTGASDDLKQVAAISRAMIHEWAMGTSVSALQLAAEGGAVSDRTRELRDAEQQHLADEAMRRAVKLLTEHRAQLDQLAGALLRHEVLDREDIERDHGRRPDAAALGRRRPAGRGRRAERSS